MLLSYIMHKHKSTVRFFNAERWFQTGLDVLAVLHFEIPRFRLEISDRKVLGRRERLRPEEPWFQIEVQQ